MTLVWAYLCRITHIGCKLCTHQCECIVTKNPSLTEQQVSRDLRIVTSGYKKLTDYQSGRKRAASFSSLKNHSHIL